MKLFTGFLIGIISTINYTCSLPITRDDGDSLGKLLMVRGNNGLLRHVDLYDTRLELTAKPEDVTYYFYTRDMIDNPVIIENNDVGKLENYSNYFTADRKTLFITHGWNNDYSSDINTLITNAVVSTYDNINVFVVNWGGIANKNYFTARYAVDTIGETEADFVNKLADYFNIPYSNFILVGHSLGAHVAGITGEHTYEKVDHIIGLDPARPLFLLSSWDGYIDSSDANYVEIIHTSHLGFQTNLGHSDFYPNGGSSQPGCFLDVTSACAHSRSYQYFADSINKEKFTALQCDTYRHFEKNKCTGNEETLMGKLFPDQRATGTFYLDTNSKEPFAEEYGNVSY